MTKTKAQLRAEAVERLKMLKLPGGGSFEYAILGSEKMAATYEDKRDALIDLLTDDECDQPCYTCSRLAELVAENGQLRARLENKGQVSDLRKQSKTSDFDNNVIDNDSREKLEADVRQMLHSAYMLAWMHGNENRRGSSFEKLHVEFYNLLDRQAAITELELNALLEEHGVHINHDGLRHFTTVEFERGGCTECANDMGIYADSLCDPLKREVAELQAKVDELERENALLSDREFYMRCCVVDMEGNVIG